MCLLLLSASVAAAPTLPERALELHDEARALYAQGKYQDAIDKLRKAVTIDPKGKMLFYNLGLIQEKLGKLDAAIEDYRKCLELEHDNGERERLSAIIDRISGAHREAQLRRDIENKSAPAPAPRPPSRVDVNPWVWVSAATASAGLFVGTLLAARASALDPGNEPRTTAVVSLADLQSDADAAHSHAIAADVAFGVAGAAALAAVVLAITTTTTTDQEPQQPARSAGWSIALGRTSLELRF